MDEPLDEQYIQWLYHQVASIRFKNPARTYWSLTRQLFTKRFVWLIPNDDNRVEDGRDLRHEFVEEMQIAVDADWIGEDCSVFEMLIGLSRRLAFETEGESRAWFWELMNNLGFRDFNDAHYRKDDVTKLVDEALDRMVWRTYDSDGSGGLFPLEDPELDQREVELWYQMSLYLYEKG